MNEIEIGVIADANQKWKCFINSKCSEVNKGGPCIRHKLIRIIIIMSKWNNLDSWGGGRLARRTPLDPSMWLYLTIKSETTEKVLVIFEFISHPNLLTSACNIQRTFISSEYCALSKASQTLTRLFFLCDNFLCRSDNSKAFLLISDMSSYTLLYLTEKVMWYSMRVYWMMKRPSPLHCCDLTTDGAIFHTSCYTFRKWKLGKY